MINVKDYGALGDGTTDDRAAIQAALDAVPPGGAVVFVPSGDYRLGDSLRISISATTLIGEGATSVLRLVDSIKKPAIGLPITFFDNVNLLAPTTIVSNVTISRLVLDGNHNPVAVIGTDLDYFAIEAIQTSYLTLSELIIRNWASDGLTVSNGNVVNDHLTIEDCLISGCHRSGIHIGFASNAVIRRCHVMDTPSQYWGPSAAHSIDVEVEGYDELNPPNHYPYVRNLTIEDCILERTNAATSSDGIALQPANGPLSTITIQSNLIRGHQFGIETTGALNLYGEIAGVHDVTILSNWLTSDPGDTVSGYPIALSGCANVDINGNVTNDVSPGDFSNGQSVAVNGAHNVQIRNNSFRLVTTGPNVAVNVYNSADTISITNNQYQSFGDTLLHNDGSATNVTVSGNTILSPSTWDTTPPSASFGIIAGTIISTPTAVTATASDAGSGVARVYFFLDGIPQGFSDTAPYTFTFDPSHFAPGSHELEALAIDAQANLSTQSTVEVALMSYTLFKAANFGVGKAGLATVGYKLTGGTRITAGVAEIGTSTGCYGATVTFADGFDGSILWDTGDSPIAYAVEDVGPGTINLTQPITDVQTATVGGALNGGWAASWGQVIKDVPGKLLKLWGAGANTAGAASKTWTLDDGTNPTQRT